MALNTLPELMSLRGISLIATHCFCQLLVDVALFRQIKGRLEQRIAPGDFGHLRLC
jgi:hypothetical protein